MMKSKNYILVRAAVTLLLTLLSSTGASASGKSTSGLSIVAMT